MPAHPPPQHAPSPVTGPAALSFALSLALYAVTLGGTWVYDDTFIAREEPRLHDVHLWPQYFREGYFPDAVDNLWRPLASLSFAVEWKLHGDRAWLFHAVNILLHAAVSALVAVLAGRLLRQPRGTAAYAAGLLFAAHPLHVEAVAYLVGRAETMTALGIAGGLFLFLRRPLTLGRAWAIFGCFLFAVFSKEQGLLLPGMVLGFAALSRWLDGSPAVVAREGARGFAVEGLTRPLDDGPPGTAPLADLAPSPVKSNAAAWLTFLLTGSMAAYVLYRDSILKWVWDPFFLDPALNPVAHAKGLDRWLIPVAILGRYGQLMFAPLKPSPDYSADVYTARQALNDPYLYAGCFFAAVWGIGLLIALMRRRLVVAFCLICFGMSYALVGNGFIIGTVFGERLMYLPSVFVCILAGLALARVPRRAGVVLLAILVTAASARTVSYARHWNDRFAFYRYALAQQPKSSMLYLLLADEYSKRGEDDKADAIYAAARAQCPDCWNVWLTSANFAVRHDRLDEAERMAIVANKLRPGVMSAQAVFEQVGAKRAATQATTAPGRVD